jgi:CheY-like chemotaxis protein
VARILVVDDERDVLDLTSFLLKREGHDVLEALDGSEGFEMAKKITPDLIVLDIMMPEMDGIAMNQRLLQDETTRDIPVLVLTAKGQMQDAFLLSANVKGYIQKPFESNEFRDYVAKILRHPA